MKKIINDPADVAGRVAPWLCARPTPTWCGATTTRRSSSGPTRRSRARSRSCPAAAPGTSRCTAGYVGAGHARRRGARGRSSPPRPRTRCSPRPRPPAVAPGVLHIVKNYTGDVLNFEVAAELADAEGIEVVAGGDQRRRRGRRTRPTPRAAAGSAARCRWRRSPARPPPAATTWPAVTAIAQRVIANVRSMGMALTPCIVPHSGEPSFVLADDEIEMGIGIHGEPGRRRMKMKPADEIVAELLGAGRRGPAVRAR